MIIRSRTDGFTMVEVMIGMVLTGILAIGMMGVWSMVGDQFFRSTIRQKAIFVLHGEMERLSALYRYNDFRGDLVVHDGRTDIIHQTTSNNTTSSDFVVQETDPAFNPGHVLLTPIDTNIVWIDQDRQITARIYWKIDDSLPGCYDLNNTHNECNVLTLYLEFPYRFQNITNPANVIDSWVATDPLTLKTIIGRRL